MANSFDMPRVIGDGASRAIEDALAHQPSAGAAAGLPYAPTLKTPYVPPKTSTHVETIKERLKQLTHREMRDFVAEIFDAHRKLRTERAPPLQNASAVENAVNGITQTQLPDILDKLAHGD